MNRPQAGAFSLVEVTVAIGIAAFCLLAVFGLLPIAQTSHQAASEQNVLSSLTSEIMSDLKATQRTTPASQQASPRFGVSVGAAGAGNSMHTIFFREGGALAGPPDTDATGLDPVPRYRATIFLTPPATGRSATTGRILVTWPAMADPNAALPPSRYSGSLETFVALDRN
jgi:type II secretory pathway pseudopilin PulG